jgi:hypothetical protein
MEHAVEVRQAAFLKDGHAKAGRNGPYGNTDTPVRNTAHWLITCDYLWRQTGETAYHKLVQLFATYLRDEERGPSGAIRCMVDDRFDHINGLIGQAWVIEALARAATSLSDDTYHQSARDLFNVQLFDERRGIWIRTEIDGSHLGPDWVFNHQLWFAAAGSQLQDVAPDPSIDVQILRFLHRCRRNFRVHHSGLIRHRIDTVFSRGITPRRRIGCVVKPPLEFLRAQRLRALGRENPTLQFESAYHWFNLLGFAILHQRYADHEFFDSRTFLRALGFGLSEQVIADACNLPGFQHSEPRTTHEFNQYLYGYNSPAFEYGSICRLLGRAPAPVEDSLLDLQWDLTCDETSGTLSRFAADPETMTARIYELTYGR